MELLFKNTSEANTELKDLLGFIHADVKFNNIKPDIISSTKSVIKIIGQEVYDLALQHYSGVVDAPDEEFIRVVRYAIVVGAYRMYVPQNDLSHTNNGRKILADDSEKSAFEWQIERSDKNLEIKYYRILDELIDFLDSQPLPELAEGEEAPVTIAGTWRASAAYKKSQRLFVRTLEEFDNFFTIESRLLYLKLAPGLERCEMQEIKPRLADKFEEMKVSLAASGTVEDLSLLYLVQKACVYYAMAWAMPRLSVNLYPEGVLQHYTSDRTTINGKKPTLNNETQEARQAFEADYKAALQEIEAYLAPEVDASGEINLDDLLPNIDCNDNFFST